MAPLDLLRRLFLLILLSRWFLFLLDLLRRLPPLILLSR
jgi:hypothetical protein